MQIICTSLQTDNHASTSSLSFYRPDALPAAQPMTSKHWRHIWGHKLHWRIPYRRELNTFLFKASITPLTRCDNSTQTRDCCLCATPVQRFMTKSTTATTSGQSNSTRRPYRRCTWTVQSYSPGGDNVHSHVTHASLGPAKSITQTASRLIQPVFAQVKAESHYTL